MHIETVSQLGEQVAQAAALRQAVYPISGNTQPHWLRPIPADGLTLNLNPLNQLIDYPHEDMTITVQAGMSLTTLHTILHRKGQTLPLDVPQPDQATVGGSIAANINGPRRLGYGTWRDFLIGLSWINDRGEEAKAGGRVVKNVAGYDFCKLMTGSMGTLGIISQVTLKVRPLPEKRVLVSQRLAAPSLSATAQTLLRSSLKPVAVWMQSGATPQLFQLFEDNAASVAWQVEQSRGVFPEQTEVDVARLQSFVDYPLQGSSVTLQITMPRSQVPGFLESQQGLLQSASSWQMQPLSGLLTVHLAELGLPSATERVAAWRKMLVPLGGYVTVPRCPLDWRSLLLPFGEPRPDGALMQQVKHALDPHNLFQRGRHELLTSAS